jgi:hypothetical protein
VIELDWWQEIHHKERPDVVIAAVPAMVSQLIIIETNFVNYLTVTHHFLLPVALERIENSI